MNDNNKSIKCDVKNCEYNDDVTCYCILNEIKVSSLKDKNNTSKKETICDSFKEKNS